MLPCLVSAAAPSEAAHIRYGDPAWGKPETGMGEKPSDMWALPLSTHWHRTGPLAQHHFNERLWWEWIGIDPLEVCSRLWPAREDLEAMEEIAGFYRLKKLPEGEPECR